MHALRGQPHSGQRLPLRTIRNTLRLLERSHLCNAHQAGVIVFVAGKRQPPAFDCVGNEAMRLVAVHRAKAFQNCRQIVPGKIRHERMQRCVIMRSQQCRNAGHSAKVLLQMFAPAGTALVHQRGVERVGAVVNPLAQRRAALLLKRCLQLLAVLQHSYLPARAAKNIIHPAKQAVRHHGIQTLAVVINHPPQVAHIVLPALQHRLKHIALVKLSVAQQRHHAAGRRASRHQLLKPQVVLRQRCKCGQADGQSH